jgi:hypothetical protein
VAKDFGKEALEVAGIAWRLPKRLDTLVTRAEEGRLAITTPRLERRLDRLEGTARRLMSALLFGALLFSGATVRADDLGLGNLLMLASLVPLLHTLFAGRRR